MKDFMTKKQTELFPSPLGDPYIQMKSPKRLNRRAMGFRPLSEILIFKFTIEISAVAKNLFPSSLGDPYIQITLYDAFDCPVCVPVPSRRSLYPNAERCIRKNLIGVSVPSRRSLYSNIARNHARSTDWLFPSPIGDPYIQIIAKLRPNV